MTIYSYSSQKSLVDGYCQHNGIIIDKELENVSEIIKTSKKGDLIIIDNLSSFGNSANNILKFCKMLVKKDISVYSIKQNIKIDNSPIGNMILSFLSTFIEMQKDIIVQRTKEGLVKAKLNGKQLGRPKGFVYRKLDLDKVKSLIESGLNKSQISRKVDCSWATLHRFMLENNLRVKENEIS